MVQMLRSQQCMYVCVLSFILLAVDLVYTSKPPPLKKQNKTTKRENYTRIIKQPAAPNASVLSHLALLANQQPYSD